MCDFFWQRSMDNNDHRGGDLSDIVRNINPNNSSSSTSTVLDFPIDPAATSFEELPAEDFVTGDPFALRDPLLHELTGTAFYESRPDKSESNNNGGGDDKSSRNNNTLLIGDQEMKRPCNLFSRVLQISPTKHLALSPRAIKPIPSVDMVKVDHGQIQISSPRPPGIKRRKSQAKRVVCIPAPAAASGRPGGEVVPSDLWAWRKYGQKPIKGSPYPRGYYRCSSSKGCSARKQVERNRTDPNMLVITYTSEHNHPWPTQRNALAGSTRSQPSKNSKASLMKEDQTNSKENNIATSSSSSMSINVKEEVMLGDQMDKATVEAEPAMASDYVFNQSDDFFADLAELESDPMSLIFARSDEEVGKEGNKGLDPFINMFDWGVSSFGDDQAKKELG